TLGRPAPGILLMGSRQVASARPDAARKGGGSPKGLTPHAAIFTTNMDPLTLLRLLQLADSALPVGTSAHSFGLESVFEDGLLAADDLESYLGDYLEENGLLEAAFCRTAHRLSQLPAEAFAGEWRHLNERLSARKLSRESRDASLTVGRRFLRLASDLLARELNMPDSHHVT